MNAFLQTKGEIDQRMAEVHERLESVKQIIQNNCFKEGGVMDGVLTQDKSAYLDCLVLFHERLERLLRNDEAHWAQNLESSRSQAQQISE